MGNLFSTFAPFQKLEEKIQKRPIQQEDIDALLQESEKDLVFANVSFSRSGASSEQIPSRNRQIVNSPTGVEQHDHQLTGPREIQLKEFTSKNFLQIKVIEDHIQRSLLNVDLSNIILNENQLISIEKALLYLFIGDNVDIPKHYILSGPPGNGKTSMIVSLAQKYRGIKFLFMSASTINSLRKIDKFFFVQNIFTYAQLHEPSVIVFDDVDPLFFKYEHAEKAVDRLEFLSNLNYQLSRNLKNNHRVFVLIVSNNPVNFDQRLLARFADPIKLPVPSFSDRQFVAKNILIKKNVRQAAAEKFSSYIAMITDELSYHSLEILISKALIKAKGDYLKEDHFLNARYNISINRSSLIK